MGLDQTVKDAAGHRRALVNFGAASSDTELAPVVSPTEALALAARIYRESRPGWLRLTIAVLGGLGSLALGGWIGGGWGQLIGILGLIVFVWEARIGYLRSAPRKLACELIILGACPSCCRALSGPRVDGLTPCRACPAVWKAPLDV